MKEQTTKQPVKKSMLKGAQDYSETIADKRRYMVGSLFVGVFFTTCIFMIFGFVLGVIQKSVFSVMILVCLIWFTYFLITAFIKEWSK